MNKLKIDAQVRVVHALVDGNSIRSVERMTGIHRDTIMWFGVRVTDLASRLVNRVQLSSDALALYAHAIVSQRHF